MAKVRYTVSPPQNYEDEIVAIKEHKPCISIRTARTELQKRGINCSVKSIWKVWKKYGMTGWDRSKISLTLTQAVKETPELKSKYKLVNTLVAENRFEDAAKIVNTLPSFPYPELLIKIPQEYLNINRQRDALPAMIALPIIEYYNRAKDLREKFEKQRKYYSALICGLNELTALVWLGRPKDGILLLQHLRSRLNFSKPKYIAFILNIFEGIFSSAIGDITNASKIAHKCKKMSYNLSSPYLISDLASLFMFLGENRIAQILLQKCIKRRSPAEKNPLDFLNLAISLCHEGKYSAAEQIIKNTPVKSEPLNIVKILIKVHIYFVNGQFAEALNLCTQALQNAVHESIPNYVHTASVFEAFIYAALNEQKKALESLKKYNPYLLKKNLHREYTLRTLLMNEKCLLEKKFEKISFIHLINILKKSRGRYLSKYYRRAVLYAKANGISGLLHLFVLFYPEAVRKFLEKGKDPGLPPTMLEFPIFKRDTPTYRIEFLGPLRIFKNGKKIKAKIPPKAAALFIHLVLAPYGRLLTDEIYRNFWGKSSIKHRMLSQTLTKLRKSIKISKQDLKLTQQNLVFKSFFVTDYTKFNLLLSKAKALLRAGEWGFARKEYLQAFKLFRGEPFKKNFDNWSVDMRFKILTQLETEAINFAKSCLEHGNKNDARKILQKVLKIIPDSQEVKGLLDGLMVG